MRISGSLIAIGAAAVFAIVGCGNEARDSAATAESDRPPSAKQLSASRAATRNRSAGAVVMALIEDVRDGAGPAVLPLYDPRIPARVGAGNVLGALEVMTDMTQGMRPIVVRRRSGRAGELVVLRLLRADGIDSRYSFLLRRQDGRWAIVYDSFLAEALQSYVVSSRSPDPAKPSPAAGRAAVRAVSALRLAALRPLRGARAAPRRASPQTNQTTVPAAPVIPDSARRSGAGGETATTGR